jgi:hypothetical protein
VSLVVMSLVAAACDLDSKPEEAVADSVLPTVVTEPPTSPPTTTIPIPDAHLVSRCIDYVTFQAYVQREDALAIWERSGQTAEGLRAECERLTLDSVDTVLAMADEMDRLDEWFAAVNAAESTTP